MEEILKNIKNKVAEVTQLAYVDGDWGQLGEETTTLPTQFPFALVDATQMTFENVGMDRTALPQNRQTANVALTLTIGTVKPTDPLNNWKIWDVMQDVHEKLQGWRPEGAAGVLVRTGLLRVERKDAIQAYRITYSFGIANC